MSGRNWLRAVAVVALIACAHWANAAISATATVTLQSVNNGSSTPYHYSVSLQNTGDTNVSTYWFGWIPGYDFMPTLAANVNSPAGWSGQGLNDSIYGNYSLEWTTTTTPLTTGKSLSGFSFDSADSPAQLTAPSQFFGTFYPNNTSWVYVGASQADAGQVFQSTVASPEPAVGALLPIAAWTLLRRRAALRGARGRSILGG